MGCFWDTFMVHHYMGKKIPVQSSESLFFLIHGVIRNFECHDSERKNVIFIFEQAVTLKKGKWHDKILQCPIKQNVTLTHHNGV